MGLKHWSHWICTFKLTSVFLYMCCVCVGSSSLAGLVSRPPLWPVALVDRVRLWQHWLTIPSGVLMLVSYKVQCPVIYISI